MIEDGILGLTDGHYNFSDLVVFKYGTGAVGGQGDLDIPTIVRYEGGTQPTFPLFRGPYKDSPDLTCPDCGHALAQGVRRDELKRPFLECPNGGGLDLL